MAPNLAKSTLMLIRDIVSSDELSNSEMAKAAGCRERAIARIRSNLRLHGRVKAPPSYQSWTATEYHSDYFESPI